MVNTAAAGTHARALHTPGRDVAGLETLGAVLRRRPVRAQGGMSRGVDRQVIRAYVADFAAEFADRASLTSSTTRAYNLCQRAGMDLSSCIGAMQQARSIVKERVTTPRYSTSPSRPSHRVQAKMSYWFSVLEDLLGLKPEPSPPA